MDIDRILSLTESKTLEFKKDLSSPEPILKTLIAFSNTAGGILIIGRDNEGKILGVENVLAMEEKLANIISDSICPILMPEIEIISVKGLPLLVVTVPRWRGPVYLKSKGESKGAYIRIGSTNRIASPEVIEELKRAASKFSYDQLPCQASSYNDLDIDLITEMFSKVGKNVTQSSLRSLGILVEDNKRLVCSNGGLILFGKQEIREMYFPNSMVRCARFKGEDKTYFIDQLDITGTILDAMSQVPKFIERNTRLSAEIKNTRRKNIPEYSPIIIREILTNALVHADYSQKGMNPKVAIYSDKLEIESPGMLPFGYTLEDFFSGVSHIRNKVIARVFRELNLMEEWGTGYKRINHICNTQHYPMPTWQEIGSTIRVTAKPHRISLETENKKKPIFFTDNELTMRHRNILQLLTKHGPLTTKNLHEKVSYSISERTLRNDLKTLREKKLIKMLGHGPSTQWAIASK